jgi:hypothetical protein
MNADDRAEAMAALARQSTRHQEPTMNEPELVPYRLLHPHKGKRALQHHNGNHWVTIGSIDESAAQQVVDHLNLGAEWSL